MRWGDFRRSDNIDDRTEADPTSGGYPSGGGFPVGGGIKLGGGALVVVVIASLLFGVNPLEMLGIIEGGGPPPATQPPPGYGPRYAPAPPNAPPGYGPQYAPPPSGAPPGYQSPDAPPQGSTVPHPPAKNRDQSKDFSAAILGSTEDVWQAIFQTMGSNYKPPRLVLFRGSTQSACGRASAATGPFYCSADRELYLDTAFFNELAQRFGAPGDFAQAYVIAHEVGHHVQNLTGTMHKYDQRRQQLDQRGQNALSVRLELQADCYAGVWGYFAKGKLDPGDLESGLRAASAVGDDQIQKRMRGYVVPESFTHGTAEQRQHWFKVGFDSGDLRKCNTFASQE